MTPQEREAIRERWFLGSQPPLVRTTIERAKSDIAALTREIDDFLKAEQVWQQSSLERALENKRLSDENERLRGVISNILSEARYLAVDSDSEDDNSEERELALINKVFDIQQIARQALEADTK